MSDKSDVTYMNGDPSDNCGVHPKEATEDLALRRVVLCEKCKYVGLANDENGCLRCGNDRVKGYRFGSLRHVFIRALECMGVGLPDMERTEIYFCPHCRRAELGDPRRRTDDPIKIVAPAICRRCTGDMEMEVVSFSSERNLCECALLSHSLGKDLVTRDETKA